MPKRYITRRARCLFVCAFICEFDMFVVEVILGCAAVGSLYRCLRRPVNVVRARPRAETSTTAHHEQTTPSTFPSRELRESHRMAERRKNMSKLVARRKAENAAMRQRKDRVLKVRSMDTSTIICLTSTDICRKKKRKS